MHVVVPWGACQEDVVTTRDRIIIRLDISSAFNLPLLAVWCRLLRRPYHEWNVTENRAVSCEDGQYVQGVEYSIEIPESSSYPYFLSSVNFMCSSSTLGE